MAFYVKYDIIQKLDRKGENKMIQAGDIRKGVIFDDGTSTDPKKPSLYLVVDISYQVVVPMMLEIVDNTIEVPLAMEVINGKVPDVLFSY